MSQAMETDGIYAGLRVEKELETVVPLRGIKVEGKINACATEVSVQQSYENLSGKTIEATYIFPLPDESAVTGLSIRAGDRAIRGKVMDREEAFQKYDDAVWEGYGAALLDQNRPNVFEVAVGNIRPKENVQIEIKYVERTGFENGAYKFRLPTVVGPRYIPGTPDGDRTGHGTVSPTDRVNDADHITPPVVDVEPGYGIDIDLFFTMPFRIQSLKSITHPLKIEIMNSKTARVTFARGEAVPDRDLVVLCWTEEGVPSGALCHREQDKEGTVALVFHPTFRGDADPQPKAVVFVVDHSGSMSGKKIEQARNALRVCLRSLNNGDLFDIIKFDDRYKVLSPNLLPYNQENLKRADVWISKIQEGGGTEILEPLQRALRSFRDAPELRFVVILTDGQVGNEDEILRMVEHERKETGIFTFGIDSAANSYLLNELASVGRGQAEFIMPWERVDDKVAAQFQRIGQPMVHDVEVEWGGLDVHEILPDPLPPIFAGEPLFIMARYRKAGNGTVTITAKGPQGAMHAELNIELPEVHEGQSALPILWAREKIQHLERAGRKVSMRPQQAAEKRIRDLALEYGLISQYTSYVAIEEREGAAQDDLPEAKMIPVAMPRSWMKVAYDLDTYIEAACCEILTIEEYIGPPEKQAEILRILARTQSADGSWGDGNPDQLAARTALALLAFMGAEDDTKRSFRIQIRKAHRYLKKVKTENDVFLFSLVFWGLMENACKENKKSSIKDLQVMGTKLAEFLREPMKNEAPILSILLTLFIVWKRLKEVKEFEDKMSDSQLRKSLLKLFSTFHKLDQAIPSRPVGTGLRLRKGKKLNTIPLLARCLSVTTNVNPYEHEWKQWISSYIEKQILPHNAEEALDEVALAGAAFAILNHGLIVPDELSTLVGLF